MMATVLVMSHWSTLIENLQASPLEFYTSLERAIKPRNIPDTTTSRVDWHEGGLTSAKREYLRINRGKHVFDICGAPFGNGFFISWWLGEARPSPIGPTLGAIVSVVLLWLLMQAIFGIVGGFFLTIFALILIFIVVGVVMSQSPEEEWVADLLVIPIIGPAMERLFCPLTYYRIDTALMFQKVVHAAVLEVLDGITKAKGIRALSEEDRKPILKDFFQR